MASFPSIQITEGEWTSGKYWDILGVKLVTFFTDNPALLADYISNFETRPDDVFQGVTHRSKSIIGKLIDKSILLDITR